VLKTYIAAATQLGNLRTRLARDDRGAALVEYSVLIGLITVAAIASILSVKGWVAGAWAALVTHLGTTPT
jgi:pilus assembly protein Flp/PilA